MLQDFYKILGVSYSANAKSIQKAFHQLAKELHPDANPQDLAAAERFKFVSEAYRTLSHPTKKSQYDLKLQYGYQPIKPVYRKPHHRSKIYRVEKPSFTPTARLLGGFSVVIILTVVLVSSFLLMRYNSSYNFQRGLSHFQNKKYSAAYFNLKQSLGPFNPYQGAAHLLMADICYNLQSEGQVTSKHIQKAFDSNPSDSVQARLLYLQGKVAYDGKQYTDAYRLFEKAAILLPNLDSAYYRMGEMDTFVFTRFDKALEHYKYLCERSNRNYDAFIGMAYCYHRLQKYQLAVKAINESLNIRQDIGMAYYIKGLSEKELGMKETACANFQAARKLGLTQAIESITSYCQESAIN